MQVRQFSAMFKARTMEFIRDRGTLVWTLVFPVMLVFGFALAFSGAGQSIFKVGVIGSPPLGDRFANIAQISFIPYGPGTTENKPLEYAVKRLRMHDLDMVVDWGEKRFWVNRESKNSLLLETLFKATHDEKSSPAAAQTYTLSSAGFTTLEASGLAVRYVDWLVPGVIGMNMLFSCLFGVGFVIVRYRKNGVLKRLKATPVSAFNFVSAQALSRLVIVLLSSVAVYAGTNVFLHFVMRGNYLDLLLLTTLAILSMIGLGLVFAARLKSEELVNGLLNILIWPMVILSGVFFSLEGSPQILQSIAQVFPLTQFIEGARKIMLEGAGFAQLVPEYLVLGGMTVGFMGLSALLFKWE